MRKHFLLSILFGTIFFSGCSSQGLSVSDPWARPAIPGGNSAAYFIVENGSGTTDTLLRAESNVTETTEIHLSMMVDMTDDQSEEGDESGMGEGQVMQMMPQESVEIPGNENVSFEPGGLHVMIIGIEDGLETGSKIEIRLFFENAGEIVLDVPVEER